MPSQLNKHHSDTLRIVVFLATILVVVRHGFNLHHYYEGGNPWMPATDWNILFQRLISDTTAIAIPTFFGLSGFLFFLDLDSHHQIIEKLRRRIRTLLIPYLLWNLLLLVFWRSATRVPLFSNQLHHSFDFSWDPVWVLQKMTLDPFVGQFWYIRTLIVFCCLSPAFLFVYRNKYLTLILFVILVRSWQPIDCSLLSTEGLLFFFIGGWIAQNGWQSNMAETSLSLALLPCLLIWQILVILQILPNFPGALRMGLLMALLFAFSSRLARHVTPASKLSWLSQYAFFIYALHSHILRTFSILLARMVPHTAVFSFTSYWLAVSLTLGCSTLIAVYSKKWCPRAYSLLNGGR